MYHQFASLKAAGCCHVREGCIHNEATLSTRIILNDTDLQNIVHISYLIVSDQEVFHAC